MHVQFMSSAANDTVGGALNIRIECCRIFDRLFSMIYPWRYWDVLAFRGSTPIHVNIVRCRSDFDAIFRENVLANCCSKYIISTSYNHLVQIF